MPGRRRDDVAAAGGDLASGEADRHQLQLVPIVVESSIENLTSSHIILMHNLLDQGNQ